MSRRYKQLREPDKQYQADNADHVSEFKRLSAAQGKSGSGSIALESFAKIEPFIQDVERDGTTSAESFLADYVEIGYGDVQEGIQTEFEELLVKESGIKRSCLHKGLISSVLFLMLLAIGITFVEIYFPHEGFRDLLAPNFTKCDDHLSLCFGLRVIRSIGLFGFFGGIANWLFIVLLFRKIPCLVGSGVFEAHHTEVINGLRHIVIEVLFDELKLKAYVSGTNKNIQKALQLNQHFEALLESSATDKIILMKIDKFLSSPHGILLTSAGADQLRLRETIKDHIKSLTNKLSKIIHERLRIPGITDGGLKTEITRILEPRLDQMEPTDINKVVTLMLRKHLSWLIIWGNVFGAILGLINEIIFIVVIALYIQ